MGNETIKYFEKLIDKECYDRIFRATSSYIEENFESLDLAEHSNSIEEVQAANLEDLIIQRVGNIVQDDEDVQFDVIVSCEIEIEETIRRDRQVDSICQWFAVHCCAILDFEFKNFSIITIETYNR